MGGWMLAGIRRGPGPLIGTAVASLTAATLIVAAISTAAAATQAPAGRLAGASVVVAGSTSVSVTHGGGADAEQETGPCSSGWHGAGTTRSRGLHEEGALVAPA